MNSRILLPGMENVDYLDRIGSQTVHHQVVRMHDQLSSTRADTGKGVAATGKRHVRFPAADSAPPADCGLLYSQGFRQDRDLRFQASLRAAFSRIFASMRARALAITSS